MTLTQMRNVAGSRATRLSVKMLLCFRRICRLNVCFTNFTSKITFIKNQFYFWKKFTLLLDPICLKPQLKAVCLVLFTFYNQNVRAIEEDKKGTLSHALHSVPQMHLFFVLVHFNWPSCRASHSCAAIHFHRRRLFFCKHFTTLFMCFLGNSKKMWTMIV